MPRFLRLLNNPKHGRNGFSGAETTRGHQLDAPLGPCESLDPREAAVGVMQSSYRLPFNQLTCSAGLLGRTR